MDDRGSEALVYEANGGACSAVTILYTLRPKIQGTAKNTFNGLPHKSTPY